ncbi:nuclear transport factor 2 family protein, partial [Flavobacterium sp. LBUM151]
MSAIDNKEILKKANEAIIQGDNEGFLSFCTDDTNWIFIGDQTLKGKDAVREYMKTAYKKPPNFEVENLIAEDDFVTAIGKIKMEDENGKVITSSYCDVWKFRD